MKKSVGNSPNPSSIYIAVCTVLFLGAYIVLSRFYGVPSLVPSLVIAAAYLVLTFVGAYVLKKILLNGKFIPSKMHGDLPNVFAAVVNSAVMPSAVFNDLGKLEWCNERFERELYYVLDGGKLDEVWFENFKNSIDSGSSEPIEVEFESDSGTNYYLVTVKPDTQHFKHTLTVWQDITEQRRLQVQNEEEKPVYCYFYIDNLEESVIGSGVRDRNAADETEKIIVAWAEEQSGGVTTLGTGKYLVVLKRKYLDVNRKNGFDIMERIKSVKLGVTGYPVTISGGFASVDGTVADNMEQAQKALEMALQRGGDQIVLVTGTFESKNREYFGGTTKSNAGFSRRDARNDANSLADLIKSSTNVIIMGHTVSDFDCIGACMGLYRIAHYFSKPTSVILSQAFMDGLPRGANENLSAALELLGERTEYRHIFVGSNDAEEMFTSNTLLIVADVSNNKNMENSELLEKAERVAYIDHHQKLGDFAPNTAFKCIVTSASSTCELVASMLEYLTPQNTLTDSEATLMLSGIMLDTHHFRRNTGRNTFLASQYLVAENASAEKASTLFTSSYKDYAHELEYEKNVEFMHGCIAFVIQKKEGKASDRTAVSRVADRLITLDGIIASFVVYHCINTSTGNDTVFISARSRGGSSGINVGTIIAPLGGGGDYEKAGAQITDRSIGEVEEQLKQAVDEYYQKQKNSEK